MSLLALHLSPPDDRLVGTCQHASMSFVINCVPQVVLNLVLSPLLSTVLQTVRLQRTPLSNICNGHRRA